MKLTENELFDYNRRDVTKLLSAGAVSLLLSGTNASASSSDKLPLHYLSLLEVAEKIRKGELRPTELTQYLLERINTVDKSLHAYVTMMADQAMHDARIAENEIQAGKYRGPLHGVPIGIKDVCYTKSVRTMAGTTVLSDFVPSYDATVVTKLRDAGAVILGKLALCEGAHFSYPPGVDVPVNPWDPNRWSGVSSSGNGVAIAAGLCFGSVGTDTGGSVRYPAATNGCVGLKPTYGRVSRHGLFGLAASLDHVGPMTRTVADAAVMLEVMAGQDPNDPTSFAGDVPDISKQLDKGVEGLRIGFDHTYTTENVDPDVAQSVLDAVRLLERKGAQIIDVTMPDVSEVGMTWFTVETVEAVLENARTFPSRAHEHGSGFRGALEYGQQVSGVDFALASKRRAALSRQIHEMLSTVDCFICPTMSTVARPKLADPVSGEGWSSLEPNDVFTKPFNMSGVPALSVPSGFSKDGLPLSVQFVGSRLDEAMICRVGHTFQQATTWHTKHPLI